MTSGGREVMVVLFTGGQSLGNDSMKPEESAQLHLETLHVGIRSSGNVTTHLLGITESHAPSPQALVPNFLPLKHL